VQTTCVSADRAARGGRREPVATWQPAGSERRGDAPRLDGTKTEALVDDALAQQDPAAREALLARRLDGPSISKPPGPRRHPDT